jgi:3D-(3,5/4)-trihydroxycyclohexane-1,2-dione acylhydrolase (decyclizing)
MGYEIAGGLGVKMAAPDREVYVLVGDGSYLMLSSEIVTAIQEGIKLTVVAVDNHGFNSIGGLSRSLGTDGFGTQYRFRKDGSIGLDGEASPGVTLPVDLVANAQSLGAHALRVRSVDDLTRALRDTKKLDGTVVIVIEVDRYAAVPNYESWWDVPVAEVSTLTRVQQARRSYDEMRKKQPPLL